MTIGRILLIIFGVLFVLGGIGLTFGGSILVWAYHSPTDEEGFVSFGPVQIERDSYAVVTGPVDIDEEAMEVLDWLGLGPVKVRGSSNDPEKDIFIGVASKGQVESYLEDVNYDELTRVTHWLSFHKAEYTNHPGDSAPAPPIVLSFWSQPLESGPGTQTLEWEPAPGRHALVLMNDDGSQGIDFDVEFMVQVPVVVFGLGVGFIVAGVVGLLLGVVMIYFAVRRP